MGRSGRKVLVVGALTLTALAGPVAAAHAAGSLVLKPATNQFSGQANTITASGTSVGSGFIAVYAEAIATTCEPTASDEVSNRDWILVGTGSDAVANGQFSIDLSWSPILASTHVICGYLYSDGQTPADAPQVLTSTPATVVEKPVNTDSDGDGVPNDVDLCRDVAGPPPTGCPPVITPVTPVSTVVPGGITPVINAPATNSDPTGVLKLKSSKGKAASCGTGCLVRTRTVGPLSFALKVKVSGAKTKQTASVTLKSKTAQAGQAGKVCVSSYSPKLKLTCKKITWAVGKKIVLTGSIATPAKIGAGSRPGFAVTAYVGQILVGGGASLYLKSSGGHIVPDTNESACAASTGAHSAC